jgi:Raf kinase inhibitor-like YbhB/YbcL family protein
LTSTAFDDGDPIPVENTCDGANEVLPLSWSGAPAGTVEFALIFDDPDAGGFVHWVVVGIPAASTALDDPLPRGAREGQTDAGQSGYFGPCPPAVHTYVLTLYALSASIDVGDEPTAAEVRAAAADAMLGTAVLTGTYGPPI